MKIRFYSLLAAATLSIATFAPIIEVSPVMAGIKQKNKFKNFKKENRKGNKKNQQYNEANQYSSGSTNSTDSTEDSEGAALAAIESSSIFLKACDAMDDARCHGMVIGVAIVAACGTDKGCYEELGDNMEAAYKKSGKEGLQAVNSVWKMTKQKAKGNWGKKWKSNYMRYQMKMRKEANKFARELEERGKQLKRSLIDNDFETAEGLSVDKKCLTDAKNDPKEIGKCINNDVAELEKTKKNVEDYAQSFNVVGNTIDSSKEKVGNSISAAANSKEAKDAGRKVRKAFGW